MHRKIILFFMFILISLTLYAPLSPSRITTEENWITIKELILKNKQEKQLNLFLNAMAYMESSNNPDTFNTSGYIGLFAFGQSARRATGYGHIKTKDFIKDPSIWSEQEQISAMITLLQRNELLLMDYVVKTPFNFKKITVTKSGLLAAAHLAGNKNVKRYFESGGRFNPKDKNGTSLEDYLIRFSGYSF